MDDYIKKFEEIAPKTLINDEGLLMYFQRGLLQSIRKKLWDAQPGPDTLEEWKEAAVKAEGRHKMARAMDGGNEWRRRTTTPAVVVAATANPSPAASSLTSQSGVRREVVGPNGRTLAKYYVSMKKRCIGCGALGHRHEACQHRDKVCDYCRGKGHLKTVCSDRFLGLALGGHAQ